MRRNLSCLKVKNRAGEDRFTYGNITNENNDRDAEPKYPPNVVLVDRRKLKSSESVDKIITSGLLTLEEELAGILDEVEEISKSLKSGTPENQALSSALERTVLCALKQSILDRELRSLALTDDLTCLYNRRAFLALASQQLKVARRKGQGLLLFFADVDNLKEINDSHGHREGDLALVRTASALEKTFRDSDIPARLGGDEFAILVLEASFRNQEAIFRRLEKSLRELNEDEFRYQLSLSVGVARFDPKRCVSLGELMAQADQAMYEEKRRRPRI